MKVTIVSLVLVALCLVGTKAVVKLLNFKALQKYTWHVVLWMTAWPAGLVITEGADLDINIYSPLPLWLRDILFVMTILFLVAKVTLELRSHGHWLCKWVRLFNIFSQMSCQRVRTSLWCEIIYLNFLYG